MTEKLRVDPNFSHPDDVYELLVEMHRDLTDEQSKKTNAKLILLLANHIGDPQVLAEAIAIARGEN
jgi:hypothetical protein